jgi:hypothetical protein
MSVISGFVAEAAPIGIALSFSGAIILNLYEAALSLRAKGRLKAAVQEAVIDNERLREAIMQARLHEMTQSEFRSIQEEVEKVALSKLSISDQRRVGSGLHQPNQAGKSRYLHQILEFS